MPTGGISSTNLASYLELPQVVACGGSWMVSPALLAAGDFDQVRRLTAEALAVVATARAMVEHGQKLGPGRSPSKPSRCPGREDVPGTPWPG